MSRSYNMAWRWTGTCARTRRKSRSTRLPTRWPGGSRRTSANPTPLAPHRHRHHPSARSHQYLTIPCTRTRHRMPIPTPNMRRTSRHRLRACRSPLHGVVDQMERDQPNGGSWNIVRPGSSTGLSSHNHHLIALGTGQHRVISCSLLSFVSGLFVVFGFLLYLGCQVLCIYTAFFFVTTLYTLYPSFTQHCYASFTFWVVLDAGCPYLF